MCEQYAPNNFFVLTINSKDNVSHTTHGHSSLLGVVIDNRTVGNDSGVRVFGHENFFDGRYYWRRNSAKESQFEQSRTLNAAKGSLPVTVGLSAGRSERRC